MTEECTRPEPGGAATREGDEILGHPRYGPEPDVAGAAGYPDAPPRAGFFTDTSVCIGCKACEVACKEWKPSRRTGSN
ncbi:hypothetical protein GCM10010339_40740 [Streptomyces alanosinicus]|uniref:4Fe-4S ferredoxin-type domain-containing protein n=1 Tax=Streptomyces alanosinicus TaxID=68171 RepID=A0A918YJI6_9ACTN|nr:hypothetical protein GCM10010339_40740 [Streptomyces alanosinicus]